MRISDLSSDVCSSDLTLSAESEVIGLKENSNRKTGVVTVRSRGVNQHDEAVVEYTRWVMVKKGDPGAPAPEPVLPDLPDAVPAEHLTVPAGLAFSNFDFAAAGSPGRKRTRLNPRP